MYNEKMFSLPLPSVLKDQQDFKGLKFTFDFLPLKGIGTAAFWRFYIAVELLIYFYVEFIHLLGSTALLCIRQEKCLNFIVYKEPEIFQQYTFIL